MNHTKTKTLMIITTIAVSLALFFSPAAGKTPPPQEGGVLPDIQLPAPKDQIQRNYLGLPSDGPFTIPQIKAQVVIIEIFSMYCPYCQREAPEVNRLFSMIENKPALKGRVKLIRLRAGNSLFEVDVFKRNYNVPFPLIPDENFSIYKSFGEVRTPYILGVRINDDRTHQVFYSKLGGFKGAEQFLELMLRLSGLKEEK